MAGPVHIVYLACRDSDTSSGSPEWLPRVFECPEVHGERAKCSLLLIASIAYQLLLPVSVILPRDALPKFDSWTDFFAWAFRSVVLAIIGVNVRTGSIGNACNGNSEFQHSA